MRPDQRLDICGEVIPVSLARCQSALARLAAGAVLEIRLRDRETLDDLLLILERSGGQVLSCAHDGGCYSLSVRKSPAVADS